MKKQNYSSFYNIEILFYCFIFSAIIPVLFSVIHFFALLFIQYSTMPCYLILFSLLCSFLSALLSTLPHMVSFSPPTLLSVFYSTLLSLLSSVLYTRSTSYQYWFIKLPPDGADVRGGVKVNGFKKVKF